MDPTAKFLSFAVFSVLALVFGYLSRQRGWLNEERSRPLHLATMAGIWSPVAMLSVWRMPVAWENLWLVVIQIILVAGLGLAAIPIARIIGCNGKQTGVMSASSGLANYGLTLGAYLCFCLITPGQVALAYAMAFTVIMQVTGVFVLFPVCRYFGEAREGEASVWKMILLNFTDIRSISMYFAFFGLCLALLRAPYPTWVYDYNIMDVLFYLGGFGTYVGIGMRLRIAEPLRYWRQHLMLAAMKFALAPAIVVGVVILIDALAPSPLSPTMRKMLIVESCMPTAVLTVMLANLFHLDIRMAPILWVVNTGAFLVIVLPVLLYVVA